MTGTIILTGAAGKLGSILRPALASQGYPVRLSDRVGVRPLLGNETMMRARLDRPRHMSRLCQGGGALLHFGATSLEAPWSDLTRDNIEGLVNVLEAARQAGIGNIVFASSMHTLGNYPRDVPVDENSGPAPDTRYAVSKLFGEAALRLFADRHGVAVTVMRIGHVVSSLAEASPGLGIHEDDFSRLVLLALRTAGSGYRLWHAVAPHPGDSTTDGRLERDYGFTFAHMGPDTDARRRLIDGKTHLGPRGRRLRGGDFAQ
ncbi:NAD-dependent epimerase/dehydratase family protein [Ancylobacter terrae]|uniref:NAD-dependent epimerase/dehydratase family protein n=1 Tax=Ancylobacter sp. sgz301288 TaxID=3342077 RepID=UPI00385F8A85